MHRLGNLAHMSSATLSSSYSSTAASTISPSNMPSIASIPTIENPWSVLHTCLLPLFNGEPLRVPVEDVNILVKRHIQNVVASAPQKALTTLEHEATELISSGMLTLSAKLSGLEEDRLLTRLVEIWGFFWDQVLPYIEGVRLFTCNSRARV